MMQWRWRDTELTMTRQSIVSSLLHHRNLLSHYCVIAIVPSRHRAIASSCYCTIVIAFLRHRIIIALYHYRFIALTQTSMMRWWVSRSYLYSVFWWCDCELQGPIRIPFFSTIFFSKLYRVSYGDVLTTS